MGRAGSCRVRLVLVLVYGSIAVAQLVAVKCRGGRVEVRPPSRVLLGLLACRHAPAVEGALMADGWTAVEKRSIVGPGTAYEEARERQVQIARDLISREENVAAT